jgi:hypothetical protein
MSTMPVDAPPILGADSAGMLMTPEEFDAVAEGHTYESSLLPGFIVPLDRILAAADRFAEK